MGSSTLDKLQGLKDAEFHALCDEILPRLFSRLHGLVPFGRNEKGDSIKGQPDSYVGDAAESCRIAIQYTVQSESWWSKAIEDVESAKKACPEAQEIVVVLPRDIDREKPKKGNGLNWREDAKEAAAPASLAVIHGRYLAQQLDTTCQDLRFVYLGIPFSRISWHALVAGSRDASTATLKRLKSLGRYDPTRYVNRDADDRLFSLWQDSMGMASGRSSSSDRRTLIPIIADSGIGKTSLLASFTEKTCPQFPVMLLLARDLSLGGSDSLTSLVMERLQGSMDPSARSSEEAYVAAMLESNTPLTVILDGLDETTNVEGIRRTIDAWIWSRLAKNAVLILSSRPEFWRNCSDATWSNSILRDDDHPKAAKTLRHEKDIATLDPMQGIDLPGRFTQPESYSAWGKGGQSDEGYCKLTPEVRQELQHPFTMRSALDLLAKGTSLEALSTRSAILSLWLKNRLKAEADSQTRVTESQYRDCLLIIARTAAANEGSWVNVDDLTAVPRFDSSNPPGPAVERLIAANILESHPCKPDQIRFSFEAVQDFFLAESMVGEIEKDPKRAATEFGALRFSAAVTRLERIGGQIASQPAREEFAQALAEVDGAKAAVVLRPNVDSYDANCRALVVSKLTKMLNSSMSAEQALATELLGRLNCDESRKTIETTWSTKTPTKRVHPLVASAAISHGIVSLVPLVFQTWWFKHDNYFVDLRPELLATTEEFRASLAEFAAQFIPADSHSDNYRRALMVLAYLNDSRAVDAIKSRTADARPLFYESLCLLAIGSHEAIRVYASLVDAYLEARSSGLERKQEEKWRSAVVPHAQVANLVTSEVEDYVCAQIDSDDKQRQLIGRFLAKWLGTERLLVHMVRRWHVDGYRIPTEREFGRRLGADNWLELWRQAGTIKEQKSLIQIAMNLRDTRVENVLIDCLDKRELSGWSCQSLAFVGSQRACPDIRRILAKEDKSLDGRNWNREMAFRAIATLRDPGSVNEVVGYLESDDGANEYDGCVGLACIGTEEAETALLALKNQSDKLHVRGLVNFGTTKCIERAIEIAKQHGKSGAAWLVEQCQFSFVGSFHGKASRQYRSDVEIQPILDYVFATSLTQEDYDRLRSIVDDIDGSAVRTLLRSWYDLQDKPEDVTLTTPKDTKLSGIAFRELVARGDDYVLSDHIEREVEHLRDYQVSSWDIERLGYFDRAKVQKALRAALATAQNEKSRRVILDLIGHVGDESDVELLSELVASKSDLVANAAFEARLRLTDPLRLAENW